MRWLATKVPRSRDKVEAMVTTDEMMILTETGTLSASSSANVPIRSRPT